MGFYIIHGLHIVFGWCRIRFSSHSTYNLYRCSSPKPHLGVSSAKLQDYWGVSAFIIHVYATFIALYSLSVLREGVRGWRDKGCDPNLSLLNWHREPSMSSRLANSKTKNLPWVFLWVKGKAINCKTLPVKYTSKVKIYFDIPTVEAWTNLFNSDAFTGFHPDFGIPSPSL